MTVTHVPHGLVPPHKHSPGAESYAHRTPHGQTGLPEAVRGRPHDGPHPCAANPRVASAQAARPTVRACPDPMPPHVQRHDHPAADPVTPAARASDRLEAHRMHASAPTSREPPPVYAHGHPDSCGWRVGETLRAGQSGRGECGVNTVKQRRGATRNLIEQPVLSRLEIGVGVKTRPRSDAAGR
jgi:hypothetical protein